MKGEARCDEMRELTSVCGGKEGGYGHLWSFSLVRNSTLFSTGNDGIGKKISNFNCAQFSILLQFFLMILFYKEAER